MEALSVRFIQGGAFDKGIQFPHISSFCVVKCLRLLCKVEREEGLHGIRVSKDYPPISHLMFGDDTFLFARASREQASILLNCLCTFSEWMGQVINFDRGHLLQEFQPFDKHQNPSTTPHENRWAKENDISVTPCFS